MFIDKASCRYRRGVLVLCMVLRVHTLSLAAAWAAAACQAQPAPAPEPPEAPSSQPASQPASLPADHSTSTSAVDLDAFFVPPDPLPEIVAEVDGEPISGTAFVHELRQMQIQFSATGIPTSFGRKDILQGAMDRSIEHVLRKRLAEDLDVGVDERAVKAWLEGVETRMKAEPAFAAFLLRAGKDETQRAIDARRHVLMQGILAAVRGQVHEELEDKARAYYRRHPQDYVERAGVEVWKLFIKAPRGMVQRDRDLARDRAEGIHKRAKKSPKTFQNLVRTYSDGGKASEGGYLGFVPKGSFAEELDAQVRAAKPGTILPLREDGSGFAIYKIGKRREGRTIPFEEVKDTIIERIYGPLIRKKVEERVEALRAAKPVRIHLSELARAEPR